ncbi:cytochrome P450 [Streptomyces albogriseolus]
MRDQPPPTPHGPAPDLFTWEFAANPYPAYAWLREHAPVHKTKLPSGVDAWLVTRYADARQTLADNRLSKNPAHHDEPAHAKGKTGIPGERQADLMTHLLNIDPPDHTRLRRLVSKAFTPRRVAEFAPRVQELTDDLIDRFTASGSGTADLIHEFAFPLPIYAICDLLGVPREDQDDFRDWAGMMIRHGGGPRGGVARSVKKMRGYLAELIHRKREALPAEPVPGEDLISGLIRASDHGEHLTENEAAAMAFILLFAGFETTVNLIGNGTYALLTHPEQRERLQRALAEGDRGLLETGVEEPAALRRPGGAGDLAVRHRAGRHRRAADRDRRPGPGRAGRGRPGPGAVRRPGHAGPGPPRQPASGVRARHPLLPGRPARASGGADRARHASDASSGSQAGGRSGRTALARRPHHAGSPHASGGILPSLFRADLTFLSVPGGRRTET